MLLLQPHELCSFSQLARFKGRIQRCGVSGIGFQLAFLLLLVNEIGNINVPRVILVAKVLFVLFGLSFCVLYIMGRT